MLAGRSLGNYGNGQHMNFCNQYPPHSSAAEMPTPGLILTWLRTPPSLLKAGSLPLDDTSMWQLHEISYQEAVSEGVLRTMIVRCVGKL